MEQLMDKRLLMILMLEGQVELMRITHHHVPVLILITAKDTRKDFLTKQ
jgi:hypothetical protein